LELEVDILGMSQETNRDFKEVFVAEPPAGLLQKVLLRLDQESKTLSMRRRFFLAAAVFLGIASSFMSVWNVFWSDVSRSGFGQYLTLLFSDFKMVLANWQDFGLGLLESFPIVSAVSLLAITLLLLVMVKYASKYSKGFFDLSFNPQSLIKHRA